MNRNVISSRYSTNATFTLTGTYYELTTISTVRGDRGDRGVLRSKHEFTTNLLRTRYDLFTTSVRSQYELSTISKTSLRS